MIVTLEEDGNDLILPVPIDILRKLNWSEGDTLEWNINGDGSLTLKKI